MQVEVYSDTVCPWCFIGKRRFALARRQRPQLNIEVSWRAFELNPDLATDGMDRDQYLMRKFGDPGRLQERHENLREAGAALGIQFRFDLIRRMPNSRASHALLAFARVRVGRRRSARLCSARTSNAVAILVIPTFSWM